MQAMLERLWIQRVRGEQICCNWVLVVKYLLPVKNEIGEVKWCQTVRLVSCRGSFFKLTRKENAIVNATFLIGLYSSNSCNLVLRLRMLERCVLETNSFGLDFCSHFQSCDCCENRPLAYFEWHICCCLIALLKQVATHIYCKEDKYVQGFLRKICPRMSILHNSFI